MNDFVLTRDGVALTFKEHPEGEYQITLQDEEERVSIWLDKRDLHIIASNLNNAIGETDDED